MADHDEHTIRVADLTTSAITFQLEDGTTAFVLRGNGEHEVGPGIDDPRIVDSLTRALGQLTGHADAWDQGYEVGRDDENFAQRGLSTDSDAHMYPHANPYRPSPEWQTVKEDDRG